MYRVSTRPLRQTAICLGVVVLSACPAVCGDPPDSNDTAHLLIGMTPNQGFEVTCEDSVLFLNPVVANDLGIMEFHIEGRYGPLPNTVCIRIPAPPEITGQHISDVADVTAVVSWLTDRPATSRVEYGPTAAYGMGEPENPALVMFHDVLITDLDPEAAYHCRVVSTDAFGNETFGIDMAFTTMPPLPSIANVSAEAVSETSFVAVWTTSRPCYASVRYGLTESYGNVTPLSPELQTDHAVAVSSLTPYTTYHYTVCGTDEHGRTVCSPDFTLTTLASELTIHDVAVIDTTSTSATVAWQTTNPATSWVFYGEDDTYGSQTGGDDLITDHTVVIEELQPNTLYRFRLLSRDAYGTICQSDEYVFSTKCAPLEIGGPFVAGTTRTSVTLSWTTSRPADGSVEYGEDDSYGQVADGDPTLSLGHELTVGDLDPGAEYHLRAVSTDSFGCTARSDDMTVMTDPLELSVFSVSVPETTATSATMSWQTTNASICWVEYGPTTSYGFASEESSFPLTEHTAILGDLAPKTLYHFRVHAADTYGQEAASTDATLTTPDQNGPGGLLIHGVVAMQIGPAFATICWETNINSTSMVHYGFTESCNLSISDAEMTSHHCMVLTGLVPGTRYHYRVSSEDGAHFTAESQTYTFLTPAHDTVPPGAPSGPVAASCESGVRLTWLAGEEYDLDGYRVYRRSGDTSRFSVIAELDTYETSFTDEDALERWTYEYALTALDSSGNESAPSTVVSATAGLGGSGRVWVYPNPATHRATTISFVAPRGADGPYTVSIYDARGRHVRTVAHGSGTRGTLSVHWNTEDRTGRLVPSGTYFCVVSFPTTAVRSKIMVVR